MWSSKPVNKKYKNILAYKIINYEKRFKNFLLCKGMFLLVKLTIILKDEILEKINNKTFPFAGIN